MLRFRTIGRWSENAVRIAWTPSTLQTNSRIDALIDTAWREASTRKNVQLFDGPMCRLESFEATPHALDLNISRTSYRTFLGTNMVNPALADEFGEQALANPIGLSTSVLSDDGFVLMGRRNEKVAYYPGRVHPFAGAAEPADPLNLFDEVRRELNEELHFNAADIRDLHCAAIVEDRSLRQPELIFHCRSTRSRDEIAKQLVATEHLGIWSIPANATSIAEDLANAAAFTPVGIATILLFGLNHFGKDWFDQQALPFVS